MTSDKVAYEEPSIVGPDDSLYKIGDATKDHDDDVEVERKGNEATIERSV